ncbi:MAG: YqzL family protein [Clostridia bacterium]|nr:YqzL family protein [Clostridia bacterium]
METRKDYWQIFALTGSIEAYLMYRGVIQEDRIPVAPTSESME